MRAFRQPYRQVPTVSILAWSDRVSANNFTIDDLREIAATCTEHGMKSYLTVNTIIYDEDVELMHQIIDAAKEANISAVIASDVLARLM